LTIVFTTACITVKGVIQMTSFASGILAKEKPVKLPYLKLKQT